ncbi:MAG: helix-turn-helix domain-containing protein [Acetobacteraceae bacterium]
MNAVLPDRAASLGPLCRQEFVCTDVSTPGERFAFWRDSCLTRCEALGSTDTEDGFTASYRHLLIPEGEFTDLRMTASGFARTPRLCRADAIDNIVLTMTLSGGGTGWFGDSDQTTTLGSGLLRIRDQARPYATQWAGADNHVLHVDVPRASLDSRTRPRVLAAAGALMPLHGLVSMLTTQMRSLALLAPDLDPAACTTGLRSLVALAAAMLHIEFGSIPAESEICEDGMLIAAQALIYRHSASPNLSPDAIARRLGCSRAHLYRLFARQGLTVAGYLREIRLQRCHSALIAAGPRATVADIAFRSGFEDPVYFSQLFRRRFGMRPSDALRGDARRSGS